MVKSMGLLSVTEKRELIERGWVVTKAGARSLEDLVYTRSTFCDLVPYDLDSAPPNSMSSIIGKGAQPFHTDSAFEPTPPRYVVLYCVDPGEAECPTNLLSIDMCGPIADETSLTRQFWIFRGGRNSPFYAPIVEKVNGISRLRFDPLCMKPTSKNQMRESEVEGLLKLRSQSSSVTWDKNDMLTIDNWRCLHARGSGAEKTPSRRLRRWTIGAENGLDL